MCEVHVWIGCCVCVCTVQRECRTLMLLYANVVLVCGWTDGWACVCLWVCVQNWQHSYVNKQCMCACMCRRDPYHGIMRSATVGYPQTLVIMVCTEKGRCWRQDGREHANVFNHTQASALQTVCHRQNKGLSILQSCGQRMQLNGFDKPAYVFSSVLQNLHTCFYIPYLNIQTCARAFEKYLCESLCCIILERKQGTFFGLFSNAKPGTKTICQYFNKLSIRLDQTRHKVKLAPQNTSCCQHQPPWHGWKIRTCCVHRVLTIRK